VIRIRRPGANPSRSEPRSGRERIFSAGVAASILLLILGCASGARSFRANGTGVLQGATIGFVPLANLTNVDGADRIVTDKILVELGKLQLFKIQEPGEVIGELRRLRILTPDRMSNQQMAALAAATGASYFLAGMVTSFDSGQPGVSPIPSAALTIRLIEASSGTVIWAASVARTGRDSETFFGLGRVTTLDRLSECMARDLVASMRGLAHSDQLATDPKPGQRTWK
jgi:hypothetical protein